MTCVIGPEPGRLFSIFQELLRIDSEPGKEGELRDYVKGFCSGIGLVTCEDLAGEVTGGESGNLVIRVPSGAPSTEPPIILNAHMDTVAPGEGVVPVEEDDRFTSAGDTVLGADDKAGVAAILAAVECIMGAGMRHRALEVLFTVQEEPGLIGAKNLDRSLLEGRWGLVLDGSGGVGGIVVEAPSRDRVKFTVRGRSAHAGVEPEKGTNAIACAAEAIAGLSLGRLDERTTANIGIINGGRACN
ncbi:MAG: M20/M25/M40 family metallo-hydrolase, partial [Actinobacteria bacterium]|nr:M20/M25/M40 family metallo-hydrolase [Actinomycetota bacterium]